MAIIIDFNTYKSNHALVPTVSPDYIIKHKCSYVANDYFHNSYVYYWNGDFKTGRKVKVKTIDFLRGKYLDLLAITLNAEDK